MSDKYPHVRAAFINAIADEGTKEEAVQFLQEEWNENCVLRAALSKIAELQDDKIQSATPDIVFALLDIKVGIARTALHETTK